MAKNKRKKLKGGNAHDRAMTKGNENRMPEPPKAPPMLAKVSESETTESPETSTLERILAFFENGLFLTAVGFAGPLMVPLSEAFLLLPAACLALGFHRVGVVRGRHWPQQLIGYSLIAFIGLATGFGIHVAIEKQEAELISKIADTLRPKEQTGPPKAAPINSPPSAPARQPGAPPDYSVQLVGVSTDMPPQSGRTYTINYEIKTGILVRKVRVFSFGYYIPTRDPFPEMTSKFYRAFSTLLKKKNLAEIPELSGSLSQPVSFGGVIRPSSPVKIIVFTFITWVGPSGASGEIKSCRTSDQASINSPPVWSICQVLSPTPADSKFEAMTWQTLINATQAMTAKVEQQEKEEKTERQNHFDSVLRGGLSPSTPVGTDDQIEKQSKLRFNNLCTDLGPLVEEVAFRLSYDYDIAFLLRAKQEPPSPGQSPYEDQARERALTVNEIAVRCQSPDSYQPSLDDTAFALQALSDGLLQATKQELSAPFDSRPFDR